ncbi:MAG: MgtC family protein [Candidatus Nomurabacteria bacterium GW2011_GWB1_47_6]|uniref:MgtC family protein n=1 Tax=Candidatus Nomurabacteria bacterium GW2011_GWB1_47_6 TaxID=1618749 RepID=A0A0G1T1K7_9BACT|nr:MAG: MgtC family protein [Candidatus Nomurabacteria bacterium GW2011_GWB1_47_6]
MQEFFIQNGDIILKLVAAMGFGMLIGAERLLMHKEAGMKTHALVAMGSAVFIIISEMLALKYSSGTFDPSRIASQIIVGIGFLGAGSIIFKGSRLQGLTTAGGLWVTAGIGMASGFGLYSLAAITTILVLLILVAMNIIEKPIRKISDGIDSPEV